MISARVPRLRRAVRLRSERGAALIFALLGLVALTILGTALTGVGMMATTMASNERDTQEALALADAGLAHAKKMILFQEWPWTNMTPLLTSGNGAACDGDELSQAPPGAPAGYPTLFIQSAALGGQAMGTGTYRVYVCDDHLTDVDPKTGVLNTDPNVDVNKRVLIRSVGITANGATATVELTIAGGDIPALLVNGNLSVRGDVNVTGDSGIIHANGQIDVEGNSVCAEQYFSATDNITGGVPEGGLGCDGTGELRPGSAPVNIRVLSPSDFKSRAEYWLSTQLTGGGGGIGGGGGGGGPLDVVGVVYRNMNYDPLAITAPNWQPAAAPATWNFSRNSFTWNTNGGMPEAVYYIDTNVSLGGNIQNASGGPAQMTILAEGWVDITGGAKMTAKLGAAPGPPVDGIGPITVLTGRDLKMNGNTGGSQNTYFGLFYARHQIDISGSPLIRGQVVALDEADLAWPMVAPIPQVNPSNKVERYVAPNGTTYMRITGTPDIAYDGNGLQGISSKFWRECRYNPGNPNPFNPEDACGPLWAGP